MTFGIRSFGVPSWDVKPGAGDRLTASHLPASTAPARPSPRFERHPQWGFSRTRSNSGAGQPEIATITNIKFEPDFLKSLHPAAVFAAILLNDMGRCA
jgi:hypothetical protein